MIVGIDLGTTNSCIAVCKNNEPILIPNSHGKTHTLSIVSLDANGKVVVGNPSSNSTSLSNFMRYLGTLKILQLGNHSFYPEELSALVLISLIKDAEKYLNVKITSAILTVPANFKNVQRKSTLIAGELVGLEVLQLLHETDAIALCPKIHTRDAVALGAAIYAAKKKRDEFLVEETITEVCPYSLGIHIVNQETGKITFTPLIERNSPLPSSGEIILSTTSDHQTKFDIVIYQNESLDLDDSVNIGDLLIIVPSNLAGEETVQLRFTYDSNDILTVETKVISSEKRRKLQIDLQSYQLSEDQFCDSLIKLHNLTAHNS